MRTADPCRLKADIVGFFTNASWEKKSRLRRLMFVAAVFAVWAYAVIKTVSRHEYFRDEIRAYSIALASPSLWQLPKLLINEGHPIVWYALLHLLHEIVVSPLTLPIASVLVAAAAMLLFLMRAPFAPALKFLFTFSLLPLFEYSVMARNYGISMLLMFCFAALYRWRRRYPLLLALVLALLANTNIHSLMLAGVLGSIWFWNDLIVERHNLVSGERWRLAAGAVLMLLAALFAVKTVVPDQRTVVTPAYHLMGLDYFKELATAIALPWRSMYDLIPFPNRGVAGAVLQASLFILVFLGLWPKRSLALALWCAASLLTFIFAVVNPGGLRHQGLMLVFLLVMYWLYAESAQPASDSHARVLTTCALLVALPIILLRGDYLAVHYTRIDRGTALSSVKALGVWLKAHAEDQRAIVVGEPDYLIEALPYYTGEEVYIPRESRFGKWVLFTSQSQPVMSLAELLDSAERLKEKNRPVFIAMGFAEDTFEHGDQLAYSYNKVLTWTAADWQRFKEHTRKVAAFWSSYNDENFDLYEVRLGGSMGATPNK